MYKLIKSVIRTVMSSVWLNYQYFFQRKQVTLSKTKRNFILFGIPNHPNLGDQAIVIAEQKFIKENFRNINLIMIAETDTASFLRSVKSAITDDDVIMYHGGGNIGSLYPLSERNRRFLLKKMRQHRIVIFPQSIFFEDNLVGKYEQWLSRSAYNQHSKLVLTVRENYSLARAQDIFSKTQCILVPDIVFSLVGTLQEKATDELHRQVLLALRDDEESCLTASFKTELSEMLGRYFKTVSTTDTMAQGVDTIDDTNRMSLLNEKWATFSKADLVVTDRLHGMLFSILTGRPCLVFANNNHKIESTISTWLQDAPSVKLVTPDSVTSVENQLKKMKRPSQDELLEIKQNYVPLKKTILE